MKITIEIDPIHLETLLRWGSVAQTLKDAAAICLLCGDPANERDIAQSRTSLRELEHLTPALDHLHQQVKNR